MCWGRNDTGQLGDGTDHPIPLAGGGQRAGERGERHQRRSASHLSR